MMQGLYSIKIGADYWPGSPKERGLCCLYFVGLCCMLSVGFLNSRSGFALDIELVAVKLDLKKTNNCQDLSGDYKGCFLLIKC